MSTFDRAAEVASRLEDGGVFLVSGERGNPMTIGWGLIGVVWGRPIFQVLVRPSRYSFSLLEEVPEFTVCVPAPNELKEELSTCGTSSGRDIDKIETCGFATERSEHISVPYIADCAFHYECRVVHVNDVVNATLDPALIRRSYPQGDFHRIYYGHILGAFAR